MVHSSLTALAQAVRRAVPRPRKAALELTEAAVGRVKGLLEQRNKVSGGFRRLVYGSARAQLSVARQSHPAASLLPAVACLLPYTLYSFRCRFCCCRSF